MANLANFRTTYPHCTIETEWLGFEHGQYLVRCCIAQGGYCVASGLSAGGTIEAAEDQARDRALALLAQIGAPPLPTIPTHSATTATHSAPQAQSSPVTPTSKPQPQTVAAPAAPATPPQPAPSPAPVEQPVAMPASPPAPQPAPLSSEPPVAQPAPPPVVEPALVGANGNGHVPAVEVPLAPPPSAPAPQPTALPSGVFDFSEVIALTNREMERLGWTKEQGRSYLIATYGKNSRTRLNDQELLSFLDYLKSLS